jgi:hypothetical protein
MLQEGYYPLGGTHGFLFKKLPQDIHVEVKSVVDKIQSNFNNSTPYNSNLEGQINKEYETHLTNKATQYIRHTVEEYNSTNYHYIKQHTQSSQPNLQYDGHCWVNFQEKYEYNPIHKHYGLFSFVIWYQIPFYKKDETQYGAGRNRMEDERKRVNHNGEFEFIHYDGERIVTNSLGIDKTMEGYMALFPSSLNHIVYPFYTSDDYRITISGNIHLQGQ